MLWSIIIIIDIYKIDIPFYMSNCYKKRKASSTIDKGEETRVSKSALLHNYHNRDLQKTDPSLWATVTKKQT